MQSGSRYRLQALYELREEGLKQARETLADAMEEVRERQGLVERRQKELERQQETLRSEMALPKTTAFRAQDLLFREARMKALEEKVAQAKTALGEAAARLEEGEREESVAAAAVRASQADLEILDKHKEKWEENLQREKEKKREEATEESALSSSWRQELEGL
jgi:chromosome segregation ATPase